MVINNVVIGPFLYFNQNKKWPFILDGLDFR
jgi:hypothetical protein